MGMISVHSNKISTMFKSFPGRHVLAPSKVLHTECSQETNVSHSSVYGDALFLLTGL